MADPKPVTELQAELARDFAVLFGDQRGEKVLQAIRRRADVDFTKQGNPATKIDPTTEVEQNGARRLCCWIETAIRAGDRIALKEETHGPRPADRGTPRG